MICKKQILPVNETFNTKKQGMIAMKNKDRVKLTDIEEKMGLVCLTPEIYYDEKYITIPEVNRPALQLAGFFDQFDNDRIQIIGNVEFSYLNSLNAADRLNRYRQIFMCDIPCIVYCRGLEPESDVTELATEYGIPLFRSEDTTSAFTAEVIRRLNVRLAPSTVIHGVLVDVYGEGVLILGDSGIGKSEAAIALLQRGHRLIADDAVEIRKVSEETLIGTAPEVTKHFIELRGIGVMDVKALFGVRSIKDTGRIDMVVRLEEWDPKKKYQRLGIEDDHMEYLGNKVVCYTIPVRPGRNISAIIETAVVNHRQKLFGYNAAEELTRRLERKKMGIEDM